MRFSRYRWRLAALALALSLGACAEPSFVADPEGGGLELRWSRGEGSIEEAQALAQSRCQTQGKRAELTAESTDGDATLARFRCR